MTTQTIIGVFPTEQAALDAIQQLKSQGIGNDLVTVIGRNPQEIEEISQDTDLKSPDSNTQPEETGGFLNSIRDTFTTSDENDFTNVGPYVAIGKMAQQFIGSDTYYGGNGWKDDFTNLGFSEAEAENYDQAMQDGKILLLLEGTADNADKIRGIFGTTTNTSE